MTGVGLYHTCMYSYKNGLTDVYSEAVTAKHANTI